MNKKIYTLSLLATIFLLPLSYNDAFSRKTDGKKEALLPSTERPKPSTADKNIFYSDAIVKEVEPIHVANDELRYIMESGNVKNIQEATKKLINAINNIKTPELKIKLKPALHFLTLMSTATTYQQMRTAYHMVKDEINPIHNKNRLKNHPYLVLNPSTILAIKKIQTSMPALNKALLDSSETVVNQKIDIVLAAVKNVHNVPLKEYLADLTKALTNMKQAHGILAKLGYQVEVIKYVNRILTITAEQK